MIKIRKSTFESNSSSIHTLVRVPDQKHLDKLNKLPSSGEIVKVPENADYFKFPDDQYYGWGYDVLSSPLDKATYLISYFAQPFNTRNVEEIPHYKRVLKEVQKTNPQFQGWQTCDDPYYGGLRDYRFGYFDHQSTDALENMKLTEILKTINDPMCVYLITNDNHDFKELFKIAGISKDRKEIIAPKYNIWWD